MDGESGARLKSSSEHSQTAETILWDLPREHRKAVYSALCDFVRVFGPYIRFSLRPLQHVEVEGAYVE